MDVRGYSYFIERRDSDRLWIATVAEFPGLRAESKVHNRALNELYDHVEATIRQRYRAGEPFPAPPSAPRGAAAEFLKSLGLT